MTNSHNVHLGGLNFAVWNVQSLQNKTHEVMEHILDLSTDLAFISETWLTSQKTMLPVLFCRSVTNYTIGFDVIVKNLEVVE